MKKLFILSTLLVFTACGLQVTDPGKKTIINPNTTAFTVGGVATGLPYQKGVTVTINGKTYEIGENGTFTLPGLYNDEDLYNVSIVNGPGGAYVCKLNNNSGQIPNANVTNVELSCSCEVPPPPCCTAGSEFDPYLVYTAEQLNTISTNLSVGSAGGYYKQMCDLDYTGIQPRPIGGNNVAPVTGTNSDVPFTGTYDGNGFFILHYHSDDTVPSNKNLKGLFGKTLKAHLKNINLSDVNIKAAAPVLPSTATTPPMRIGGLVADAPGTEIVNVYGEKIYIEDGGFALDAIGGIVGAHPWVCGSNNCNDVPTTETKPSMSKVHVKDVELHGSKSSHIGGVVGRTRGLTSMIESESVNVCECLSECGGVFGRIEQTYTFSDISSFDETVSGSRSVGGIVGASCGHLARVYSAGTVKNITPSIPFTTNADKKTIGGIVGWHIGGAYPTGALFSITDSFTSTDIFSPAGSNMVGKVYGNVAAINNVAYDSPKICENCTGNADATMFPLATTNSLAEGADAVQATWDFSSLTPVWCVMSPEFPRLAQVPFSSCSN